MPTLTETLSSGVNELGAFNALLAQYLDALAAAQSNAVFHTLWVDAISGDNSNDGLTATKPLQTINAAVNRTPNGSYIDVKLLSDYTMEADILSGGRIVRIVGSAPSGAAAQRLFNQTAAAGAARCLVQQGGGAFHLHYLDITLAKTAVSVGPAAFLWGRIKSLLLFNCGLNIEAGVTTTSVMGQDGVTILEVSTVTALDDAISGYWLEGAAAGVNPNTVGKLVTNVAAL